MTQPEQTENASDELQQLRRRVAVLERQLQSPSANGSPQPAHLEAMLNKTTDAIWSLDGQERLVFFNQVFGARFAKVFGVTPQIGQGPEELLPEPDRRHWRQLHRRALEGESVTFEQIYEFDGEAHVFQVSLYPMTHDGIVSGLAAFSRDVTEYKRAQDKLQDQTDMLELILASIGEGVVVADRSGHFLLFNPAAERMVGIGAARLDSIQWQQHYGLYLSDGVTPFLHDQLPLVRAYRGEAVDDSLVFVRNDNNREGTWLSVNARPLIDRQGVPRGGVAVFRNTTEKKKSEEALAAQHQFLEQLIEAHERDRQLMAYEIHDGLVQDITGALMHLESIVPPQMHGRSGSSFELVLKLLRESLDEGRRVISGLRPPILDEMGIVAAIDYLVSEHASQGVSAIRFNHDVLFDRLEPLLEGTLFRITQEALNNIKKHSKAPSASVDLTQAGDKVQLCIRDRGVGFDPQQVDKRRFGLKGMRERAKLLHGRADIESQPGRGTRIFVELPLALPLHLMKRANE